MTGLIRPFERPWRGSVGLLQAFLIGISLICRSRTGNFFHRSFPIDCCHCRYWGRGSSSASGVFTRVKKKTLGLALSHPRIREREPKGPGMAASDS